MAKKAELLAEAKKLKLDVNPKNTIAEIEAAIKAAPKEKVEKIESAEAEKADVLAKSGKRSAKAIKEVEDKQAKEERKAEAKTSEEEAAAKPKILQKPARSRLERRSKKYRQSAEKIDKDKLYSLKDAVQLSIDSATTKFDSTVELHLRLGVDPKHADQNIRDTVALPAGTGKTVRVAVYADVDDITKAKKAGAEIAGGDDFLTQLDKGIIDFDVLIAPPTMMPKLGKYARVLGPKGLMPNPKSGTVAVDVEKAIKEAKSGRVEYRVDNTGNVHVGAGKVSFGSEKLGQNIDALLASIKAAKPTGLKGAYVQAAYLTTTMGPSVKVDISSMS